MPRRLTQFVQSARTALRLLVAGEVTEIWRRASGARSVRAPDLARPDPYEAWLAVNPWNAKSEAQLRERFASHDLRGLRFTVYVLADGCAEPSLRTTLQSLARQVFEDRETIVRGAGELDVAGIASAAGERHVMLADGAAASGELLVAIRAGDSLAPNALAEFVLEASAARDAKAMYCDDDLIDATGRRHAPRFKADPTSRNAYRGQLVVVRRSVAGASAPEMLGTELLLDELVRSGAAQIGEIRHLPLVLHHRAEAAPRSEVGNDPERPHNPNLAWRDGVAVIVPRRFVRGAVGKLRALMFTPNLNREGAPLSQFELTKALAERGVIIPEVVSCQDGALREVYEDAGIRVNLRTPVLPEMPTLARYRRVVADLAAFVREKSVDVVYANTLLNFPAVAAAQFAGVPSLWNPRESEAWDEYFAFLSESVAQEALRCFTLPYRVVFVARATLANWSRFNVRGNFTVIHNALDLRRFQAAPDPATRTAARNALGVRDGQAVVLLVGTVCERKGQRDLAAALRELPESLVAGARFFVVGDEPSPYSDALRRDIDSLPTPSRVRVTLVSTSGEIERYYRAADVFLLTSRIESFPRVILEAMASDLPIITTPTFGVTEQVAEGRNALFYPPGDSAQLARHLAALISDPARRTKMAVASREVFGSITTFDRMVDAYAELFREAYFSR